MTAREIVYNKIKEIEKDFGKNISIFLETTDRRKFLVVLDFFEYMPMGQMMKYVSFLWELEEEYQIKTIHCLPAFHKKMLIWVGETDNKDLIEEIEE